MAAVWRGDGSKRGQTGSPQTARRQTARDRRGNPSPSRSACAFRRASVTCGVYLRGSAESRCAAVAVSILRWRCSSASFALTPAHKARGFLPPNSPTPEFERERRRPTCRRAHHGHRSPHRPSTSPMKRKVKCSCSFVLQRAPGTPPCMSSSRARISSGKSSATKSRSSRQRALSKGRLRRNPITTAA